MCFLDVVSINQVDPELMDRGIYGLGGFLAASSELRILWSPPYLSRLAVETSVANRCDQMLTVRTVAICCIHYSD